MLKELDDYGWENAFGEGCAEIMSPKAVLPCKTINLEGINREGVKRIVKKIEGENEEASWTGIFELHDGRYITVCSWCDYTGWDCQAGGEIFVADREENAILFGLSESERERLGYTGGK